MLEEIKNRLINTLPFYTADFSDFIEVENLSKIDDNLTLTLKKEFDISKVNPDFSIFTSGIYSSWNLNLNPSLNVQKNKLCLTIEANEECYLDSSYFLNYYLNGVTVISTDLTLEKEIKGYVKLLNLEKYLNDNGQLITRFYIVLNQESFSLSDFIQFCKSGYTLDVTNAKIFFLNLINKKYLGLNRTLKYPDITQNTNKKQITYKINEQELLPSILQHTKAGITFNHRIYKTGITLNNFDLLLTEHLQDDGDIIPQNSIYILDGGSTALTNLNTASGQDGDGSFYTRRQRTFSIILLIPNKITDNKNNSLYADTLDASNFYIDKIIKEFQGSTLNLPNEVISNITLLDNLPVATNNANLFARSLTFQSTSIFHEIRIKERNPTPLAKGIDSVSQTNTNKDTYLITTIDENL